MGMGESADAMEISAEQVRELRDLTGAGMMDCKRALVEAGGDMSVAQDLLRRWGVASAAKRAGRTAAEGLIEAYVHLGRVGALVEVNCETDFVANTDEFRTLARDLAMQVAALDPWWVSREDVPEEVVERERKVYETQARDQNKPEDVIALIVEGKLDTLYKERCLLEQVFFKDTEQKRPVGELITELSAKVGEKIQVRRFVRYQRGEDQG
jgi:elongation factor Ts